jgi:thiazole synthase
MPGKYCFCGKSDIAEMAKAFAAVRVGQMNFKHRNVDRLDGIEDRNRCMCEACRVQQHGFRALGLRFVQPVDQMAFVVRLPEIDIGACCAGQVIQSSGDIVKRIAAIDFRLSCSQQIEIRAIQDKNNGSHSQSDFLDNDVAMVAVAATLTLYDGQDKKRDEMNHSILTDSITITLNGEVRRFHCGGSVADLVREIGLEPAKVAVERNLEIVPRSTLSDVTLCDGDILEIVHFVGGGQDDSWAVAGRTFRSRLIVGTGKYKDFEQNAAALIASGAEIITVAVRRVNVSDPKAPMLTDYIDPEKYTYLPNTAGCFTADDAIRTLRLAREAGGWDLVKLEVLGEAKTLYPDMRETLKATEILAREGFLPMVYCVDDPIAARQLEEAGAVAIMPLGAPIGSGLGIQNRVTIRLIVEGASVPVLVDAGVGTASDAAVAMELGCDGVLMNTAIAEAKDPVRMAVAMKLAVESGRMAYQAGRMARRMYADPSSPLAGLI